MKKVTQQVGSSIGRVFNHYVIRLNSAFNNEPIGRRKMIAGIAGILIALICSAIIMRAIVLPDDSYLRDKNIVPPKLLPMPSHNPAEVLTPLGKMKGEIDGEFEAFYLAIDKEGTIYMNRNPPFENMFEKSPDWKAITNEQFREYEKQLQLLPPGNRGIKR